MPWNAKEIEEYRTFTKTYISTFKGKIDCADLAISALVEFAGKKGLPLRFKYYKSKEWKWMNFNPNKTGTEKFKKDAMRELGALNIIDNSIPIPKGSAKPGDLIMSKWDRSSGHTRIIHSIKFDTTEKKYKVVWYQGDLPAAWPEKKEDDFSDIKGVYGGQPRRWNFENFNSEN